jgi:hypothetical protein
MRLTINLPDEHVPGLSLVAAELQLTLNDYIVAVITGREPKPEDQLINPNSEHSISRAIAWAKETSDV